MTQESTEHPDSDGVKDFLRGFPPHEAILQKLYDSFNDFRQKEFTDLRVQVAQGFARIDRLDDKIDSVDSAVNKRIKVIEDSLAKKAMGAKDWVVILVSLFGGSTVLMILSHILMMATAATPPGK